MRPHHQNRPLGFARFRSERTPVVDQVAVIEAMEGRRLFSGTALAAQDTLHPMLSFAQAPAVSVGSVTPSSIAVGKSGSVLVTVSNEGTTPARGVDLTLSSSTDGVTPDGPVLDTVRRGALVIPPGKSKRFNLRFKATSALEGGDYFPYVSVMAGGATGIGIGNATFSVAPSGTTGGGGSGGGGSGGVDFLTLLGFNAPGSTWNYNLVATAHGLSATGTASATVTEDSPTTWDWSTNINTNGSNAQAVNEDLTWEQTDTGVNLDSLSEGTGTGGNNAGTTITFANPQICGPILKGKVISTSPISIDSLDGVSGTAKFTTTLVGTSTVHVPAGTFKATVISLVINFSASGSFDNGGSTVNLSLHGTDTQTFYGVSGVGLVKIVSAASEAESQSGQAPININTVITSQLTSYQYQAP